jgi:transmembrane sensor
VTPSDEVICTAIAQQAGEWFIANQAGPLSGEDSAAFLAWLKASPIHVGEYLGVARIAYHLPAAVGQSQASLEAFLAEQRPSDDTVAALENFTTSRPSTAKHRLAWQAWPITASLVALIALAISLLWWRHDGELFGIPKTYQTSRGNRSIERLPDGSVLYLDTDSEAKVRYSKEERLVEVNRGQALFEVTPEGRRRFRVVAGNSEVIAVGTRFDVYRKPETTEITVADGKIAVFVGEPLWLTDLGQVPPEVQRVAAGHQVRVDASGLLSQPQPADLNQVLGWLEHKINFQHRPLGEVAEEFNRYGSVPVQIEDKKLRALRVSGMFDAGDTESFVAFLETLPGVRVEKTANRIRVIKVE